MINIYIGDKAHKSRAMPSWAIWYWTQLSVAAHEKQMGNNLHFMLTIKKLRELGRYHPFNGPKICGNTNKKAQYQTDLTRIWNDFL